MRVNHRENLEKIGVAGIGELHVTNCIAAMSAALGGGSQMCDGSTTLLPRTTRTNELPLYPTS
jgi:hypothetical protein